MRKLALITVFALVLGLASGAMAFGNLADGTYTGTGEGFNDDIEVEVTVDGGEVTDIETISHEETPDFWEEAVQTKDDIIATQSTEEVDTETGATGSSEGIVAAVDIALADAEAEEPADEPEEEELPETGGGLLALMPGIGGAVAAGGALLLMRRK